MAGWAAPDHLEQMVHYWAVERHEVAAGIKGCEPWSLARRLMMQNFIQRSTLLVPRDLLVRVGLCSTAT